MDYLFTNLLIFKFALLPINYYFCHTINKYNYI